jgi:Protein of unknown function (DUF1552)
MSFHPSSSRRQFLRGFGALVALPTLESLIPTSVVRAAEKSGQGLHPLRLAFVYTPNGKNMDHWRPQGEGREYQLSRALKPLEAHRNDFMVISGLAHQKAAANGDGGGDHARANATFLTGCQARKTAGADIKVGVSVDQLAAQAYGTATRLPSLELTCDEGRKAGACDSGYACAYQFNLSWKSANTPMTPERDPKQIFDRLFGSGLQSEDKARGAMDKSVLDFVMADTRSLQKALGKRDQEKLDEYLTSVRQIERRMQDSAKAADRLPTGTRRPGGIPSDYKEHLRTMFDMMVLAFQTDSTRVASFLTAHDGSNRSFPEIGVHDAHHGISHHQRNPDRLEGLAKIDEFYSAQFAYFLERLKSIKEGSGTLLDHSAIVFGSALSDPDRHNHNDLPVILAGGGNGTISSGRHLKLNGDVPMTNLYLSLLDRVNVPCQAIGDSSGKLEQIA